MRKLLLPIYPLVALLIWGCQTSAVKQDHTGPYLKILGVAQDAGYPQAGCKLDCCLPYWEGREKKRLAVSLGLVAPSQNKAWMIDATPDFKEQVHALEIGPQFSLAGIFITHAHIGHYTGLVHVGREVMGTEALPVYAMPRMRKFLEDNGPWEQLVTLKNIELRSLASDSTVNLSNQMTVTPYLVPHRDEYSETVGYKVKGPARNILFIPDINKWELWERDILEEIKKVDLAFIDGSFYQNGELPNRDMSEIPHPFIEESMQLFAELSAEDKGKIHFIHFNHTNPIMRDTPEKNRVLEQGYKVAEEGSVFEL
ncbi:MAG: MBL fold metallo-hydrolase [Cyclobacteriaceae bacterium]